MSESRLNQLYCSHIGLYNANLLKLLHLHKSVFKDKIGSLSYGTIEKNRDLYNKLGIFSNPKARN